MSLEWLDEKEFYEECQRYRWSELPFKGFPQEPTAAQTFEMLKAFIREKMDEGLLGAAPHNEE